MHTCYYKYLPVDGAEIFTFVGLPEKNGKFPTAIFRSPYEDFDEEMGEAELCEKYLADYKEWLDAGYAVVFQHCRGRGKSTGDCVPYIYEREDGLALRAWIRGESFYSGQLFLVGTSYTASVHYVTAPYEDDICGGVFNVQDTERYNCNYRNGIYKMGLHGKWYVAMYKKKSIPKKNFVIESYNMLPLSDFSKTVFGERVADFDEILKHPKKDDPFWQTRFGGGEAHNALCTAKFPMLIVTGLYDLYTGGIFDMWRSVGEQSRKRSAFVVHPYDHGGGQGHSPIHFEDGTVEEHFGNLSLRWCEYVRGRTQAPVKLGEVTYYRLFDGWHTDSFHGGKEELAFPLGDGERTYIYNPYAPAKFEGGLSTNFGGARYQNPPDTRYDIITVYTDKFNTDTDIDGKMTARLRVKSSALDTCFYMRVSLETEDGDYGLRDDINQISNFAPDYKPGEWVDMDFTFDEHSFVVKKGGRLRIDITSSAFPYYVPHTNQRGLFSEQRTAVIAENTVDLSASVFRVPSTPREDK